MGLERTKELLKWLKENRPQRQYDIEELHELVEIVVMDNSIQNDISLEKLPQSVVKALIEESKESGDLSKLEERIERFKKNKTV